MAVDHYFYFILAKITYRSQKFKVHLNDRRVTVCE